MYRKPFLGCAYYPEDWPESQIPEDIAKMKQVGISCARIGEFAWRKMEPKEGEYDFGWLHRVVDALREADIAVIMGTPTATPPIWLSQKHPEVFVTLDNGVQKNHGGRRHCCSSNPDYLAACDAIVEAMGKEFGSDPAIIGWQLDNEIYSWDHELCTCPHCMERFHADLEKAYGTVEQLNEQWDLNLFSQAYDRFDEVPPATNAWHNPHILYEWTVSHQHAHIDLMHREAAILKKYTDAPIGTDMMPFLGVDYEKMNEKLDVVMFNHYQNQSQLYQTVFWMDYLRNIKEKPFWNTETAPTWPGSVAMAWPIQPEGFCRANSWLPVLMGGEGNMYWLWREHWAGHELLHGSVLSPEGRFTHTAGEIRRTADEMDAAAALCSGTRVDSCVAIQCSSRNWELFAHQPVVPGMDYIGNVYDFHRTLTQLGVRPDGIGVRAPLDKYKVLVSPLMMTLEDGDLPQRIADWVKAGGVWVAGPLTDVRNAIGAHYTDRAMGMLEELLGVRLDYTIPTSGDEVTLQWRGKKPFAAGKLVECCTLPENAEALVRVTDGHSALLGKAVVSVIPCGKGAVILCGTLPDEKGRRRVLAKALKLAGVTGWETTGAVQVIPRSGEAGRCVMLVETDGKAGTVRLPRPMTDLLTGRRHPAGVMQLAPYDVCIFTEEP